MIKQYLEDFVVARIFASASLRVDTEQIKSFAAEFDPQPFHLDEEAAREAISVGWPQAVGRPDPTQNGQFPTRG